MKICGELDESGSSACGYPDNFEHSSHSWECEGDGADYWARVLPSPDSVDSEQDEHRAILLEAMGIYIQREKQYKGLWKTFGALDSAMHLRSKGLRAFNTMLNHIIEGRPPEEYDLDSALDFINYAVFFIRNVREGRLR